MVQKRTATQKDMERLLAEFKEAQHAAQSVHQVEQPLELHLWGTTIYIPSYTRSVMDENHGRPIMGIEMKTFKKTARVFFQPGEGKAARKLRNDTTLGPASFAFGVPLRQLRLKIPAGRRVILPLNILETPDEGTVYWASFGDIEIEKRNVDEQAVAAAKQLKAAKAQARKAARATKPAPGPVTESGA